MKTCSTDEFRLYIGTREGYNGKHFDKDKVIKIVGDFQNNLTPKKLVSVRLTSCTFIVGDWHEDGWELSCINYPFSPKPVATLENFMTDLAKHLMETLKQARVFLVTKDKTTAFENKKLPHRIM